jgi:hypothetical protein
VYDTTPSRPNVGLLIGLGIFSTMLMVIGVTNAPQRGVEDWSAIDVTTAILGLVGVVLFLLLMILMAWLVADIAIDARTRWVKGGDTYLMRMEAASMLTREQTMVVAGLRYGADLGLLVHEGQVMQFLITEGGDVPLEFVEQFLKASDAVYLQPISTFSDGTHERDWVGWLTDWAVANRFAQPFTGGNRPAKWASPASRHDVATLIGITLIQEGLPNG